MNAFMCRKSISKPMAWIFPILFLLVLTLVFVMWKKACTAPYSMQLDYSTINDQSSSISLSQLDESEIQVATEAPSEERKSSGDKPAVSLPHSEDKDKDTKPSLKTKPAGTVDDKSTVAKETENKTDIPDIFGITPTYKRSTQKVDLTSLCHTLSLVPRLVWIVVEDATEKSGLVGRLLQRCKVKSIHMNVKTPPNPRSRGVLQRNAGLNWVRTHCSEVKCNGVVYFMDDDNKYDLRLFEQMRKTKGVSVFTVAFSGGLAVEGPVCKGGKAVKWIASYAPERSIPIDMAGFAINVQLLLENKSAVIGKKKNGATVFPGYLEPEFVGQFATRDTVECRSSDEVLVWHTKTQARISKDNGPSEGIEV